MELPENIAYSAEYAERRQQEMSIFEEYDLMDMIEFTGAFEPVEWTEDGDLIYKMGTEERKLSGEELVSFLKRCDQ